MRTTDEGRPTRGESEDVALTLDELEPYADAAEQQTRDENHARASRTTTSDTVASGERSSDEHLTDDDGQVRRDVRISGQEMTLDELAASGTNADLTDPDAQAGGIAHSG